MKNAKLWIDGRWSAAEGDAKAESVDPGTGVVLGTYADATVADAERSIAAARRAFDQGDWAYSPRLRAQVLLEFADRVEARKQGLAELLARETGKLLPAAQGELAGAISELRFYAGLARTIFGRTTQAEPGALSLLTKEPAGVAGAIVPWNAAAILLVRSLAPAMATGCTSVVKCAPQSALFQTELLACLAEVEALPAGVVNCYAASGADPSRLLVTSSDVDVISFTGSSPVGQRIMMDAAPTLKRLNLELGGKAPAVVFEDADPAAVAGKLVAGGLIACGQQCTAIDRIVVHERLLDPLRDALIEALRNIRLGQALEQGTQLGPLIDIASRDRIERVVDDAAKHGEVLLRGEIPGGELGQGAFIAPSLFEISDLNAPMVQEEFFGPLLNLESFSDEAEGVARANSGRYGLAASVWTHDSARAQRVARAIRSGTVWINTHNKLIAEAETGGFRASGFGRLHGADAMAEFLETKHIYQDVGRVPPVG